MGVFVLGPYTGMSGQDIFSLHHQP
jgi:hypothetical protein